MNTIIKNARIVNEGQIIEADLSIKGQRIEKIASSITPKPNDNVIDADGKYLLPGVIDDQVHFREPGLTHKANIYTEAKAAVAGGTTSFMEMPNTKPPATTQEKLEEKYKTAAQTSLANYSFFMGGANDNYDEVMKTDLTKICGLKLFMGSSTGNMLVDDERALRQYFGNFEGLIATHCEDEHTVRANEELARQKYGDEIPFSMHPLIRSVEACYLSSSKAVALAKENNTRLHILHISTAKELDLFRNDIPLKDKRITSEVCVHHLYFDSNDYYILGSRIKCNPAIKAKKNKIALFEALLDDRLDIIATDHAPHTFDEKRNLYFKAPSGLPLVQHSLYLMLDYFQKGKISIERVVEKMSHAPAICFNIKERGFIREGYYADLVLVDAKKQHYVSSDSLYYKCGWSPLVGTTFGTAVTHTFVSGHLAYENGVFYEEKKGERMSFEIK
ncbi:MAG: dihydroorotase [Chitinophagales bacterium]